MNWNETTTKNVWISGVALFRRAWIEIKISFIIGSNTVVALFRRAWIEIPYLPQIKMSTACRSLQESVNWNRLCRCNSGRIFEVALFRRAWIEIYKLPLPLLQLYVALFRRAWIEIVASVASSISFSSRSLQESVNWNLFTHTLPKFPLVALFRRAWIEINSVIYLLLLQWKSLSSGERELKSN